MIYIERMNGGNMQQNHTGILIRNLRIEHHMTQKQLADQMHISDKTISKWERGLGLPDISILPKLANILEIDAKNLLSGDITPNDFVSGNLKNTKFYVCPICHNITLCTGNADVFCCGKKLAAQSMKKASEDEKLSVELIDNERFITSNHPMTKDHYISFIAFVTGDHLQMIKQYPEWDLNVRIPKPKHGLLVWYCTKHGLFYQLL